jgi:hypothetical protein
MTFTILAMVNNSPFSIYRRSQVDRAFDWKVRANNRELATNGHE